MLQRQTRKEINEIRVWIPLLPSVTAMGATVLKHDGGDPRQQEAVQIRQATRSRRGGAPAGPDVLGVAKPPG